MACVVAFISPDRLHHVSAAVAVLSVALLAVYIVKSKLVRR